MIFITEKFVSIQGEGLKIGTPAFFIRTAYCNLRCPWCDTKYSWTRGYPVETGDLVQEILSRNLPLTVVTGGEPLIYSYELAQLITTLNERGYEGTIQIETNATIEPTPLRGLEGYVLTLSPKVTCNYKAYSIDVLRRIINGYNVLELKLVASVNDIPCVVELLESLGEIDVPVVIQPLYRSNSSYSEDVRAVVKAILSDVGLRRRVRVIPQLHKFVGIK